MKELENEEKTKFKASRREEIIKIREEINKRDQKTIEKISKTKRWFLERINKIDKPLARVTKKRRERTQINKIRIERGEITTDTTEIQKNHKRILQSYANKLDNLEENGQVSRSIHPAKVKSR